MKRIVSFLTILVIASLACGLPTTETPSAETQAAETATQPEVQNEAGEVSPRRHGDAVLYFTIGMHIEPMGETAQGYKGGKADYHNPQFFDKQVQDILTQTNTNIAANLSIILSFNDA